MVLLLLLIKKLCDHFDAEAGVEHPIRFEKSKDMRVKDAFDAPLIAHVCTIVHCICLFSIGIDRIPYFVRSS